MMLKNAAWSGRRLFILQGDEARLSEDVLYHLFLAVDMTDEPMVDRAALRWSPHQSDRQPAPSVMSRRRVLPLRRHLRNK
jgi:hypothetical protein